MLAQGTPGHIVNTASVAGLVAGGGGSYGATKHAVVALSESLAAELAARAAAVKVSVLCPGWVRTRMGGRSAPVDLETGQRTQSWLAVSTEPAAMMSGRYWYQQQQEHPAREALDHTYQDQLLNQLRELTGIVLPQ